MVPGPGTNFIFAALIIHLGNCKTTNISHAKFAKYAKFRFSLKTAVGGEVFLTQRRREAENAEKN